MADRLLRFASGGDRVTSGTALAATLEELLESVAGGESGASRTRLVSVTGEVDVADPIASVFAGRLASDRWFCWEQPEAGFAVAGMGSAHEVPSRGPERFGDVVRACTALTSGRAAAEPAETARGVGPIWVGGFAFDERGGGSAHWSSFPPALLFLPELALVRRGGRTFATAAIVTGGGRDPGAAVDRIRGRLASLGEAALPMLDPHPTGEFAIRSVEPPEGYEASVASARERIRAGELEKTVLAREVTVDAPTAHDPAALHGAMRELFPACFCFCVGSPSGAFCGASPELLVRRNGAGAATVALAGSTRRSADPAVDDHLGEQLLRSEKERHEHELVSRRIQRLLRPHSVWVEAAREPGLIKVANIQHLATPIRAQLTDARSAVELAALLHPTPAVGGEPRRRALELIAELEGMDRGWYAGPVGWMDAAEDGEFCVALRSALLRDRRAHLFAGAGIVADSDPASELAETEVKLGALLPLLSG
jgi:salicylate biosynthesis isochorismate synthase/menaquinone-specific isochorismate synthase